MALRRASAQLLASRSVHLRIAPRPASLSESREIFRVLQRFGEISTYKNLKYEYHNPADNSAIVIFREADSAQKALDASPIRFSLENIAADDASTATRQQQKADHDDDEDDAELIAPTPTKTGLDEILSPSQLSTRIPTAPPPVAHPTDPPPLPFDGPMPSSPPRTTTKSFQVTVDRSRVLHQDYIERQPFWRQFNPMKSMAQEDLAKSVPYIGLSDVSKRPPNAHRTPNWVLRNMSDYVQNVMPTLKGIAEGGEREQAYRARKGL